MTLEDEFRLLVSGYFGVHEMDEYILKEYVLSDIENYIKHFIVLNPIPNYDYFSVASEIQDKVPLKTKLQDSLLTLRKIDGSLELILMIKEKISEIK